MQYTGSVNQIPSGDICGSRVSGSDVSGSANLWLGSGGARWLWCSCADISIMSDLCRFGSVARAVVVESCFMVETVLCASMVAFGTCQVVALGKYQEAPCEKLGVCDDEPNFKGIRPCIHVMMVSALVSY